VSPRPQPGDGRHREEVGGPGQQELPGAAVRVDGCLDREDQRLADALDLIDDQWYPARCEVALGIRSGRLPFGCIVHRPIVGFDPLGDEPYQRGLAGLPWSVHDNGSEALKRVDDKALG
jgi:hypothetical protein